MEKASFLAGKEPLPVDQEPLLGGKKRLLIEKGRLLLPHPPHGARPGGQVHPPSVLALHDYDLS